MIDLDRLRKDIVLYLGDQGFPLVGEGLRRHWPALLELQTVDDATVDLGVMPPGATLLATRVLRDAVGDDTPCE